jgi:hypothetical protein
MNTLYYLEEWRGEQRIRPPWKKFTPVRQLCPRGKSSPQGDNFAPGEKKFTPGGQLRPWGQSLPPPLKLRANVPLLSFFTFFPDFLFLLRSERNGLLASFLQLLLLLPLQVGAGPEKQQPLALEPILRRLNLHLQRQ